MGSEQRATAASARPKDKKLIDSYSGNEGNQSDARRRQRAWAGP